jgi:hypothetical protein
MSRKRRNRQTLFLLDGPTSAALLRQRLASRQWWMFVIVNFTGLELVERIEHRFYSGRANRDFEMIGMPYLAGLGAVAIALGRKRRMSARELARHFDAAGMVREAETLAKHGNGVIVLASSADAFRRVQDWLARLTQGEPAGAI